MWYVQIKTFGGALGVPVYTPVCQRFCVFSKMFCKSTFCVHTFESKSNKQTQTRSNKRKGLDLREAPSFIIWSGSLSVLSCWCVPLTFTLCWKWEIKSTVSFLCFSSQSSHVESCTYTAYYFLCCRTMSNYIFSAQSSNAVAFVFK